MIDLQPHPDPSVDVVQGDLADADVLAAALEGGVDAVVHLAAVTSVLRSLEHPELTYRTNVAATAGLLEARPGGRRQGAGVRVDQRSHRADGRPGDHRGATLRPLTPYGSTKAAGEMLMSAYTASYGVRCAACA